MNTPGFSIATFNVRDLFDDRPPQLIGELDRYAPPDAPMLTRAGVLYRAKLDAIAMQVARLDADVIAFQEIKNAQVLADLCVRLPQPHRYVAPVAAKADGRGISCGLLSRFPIRAHFDHVADVLSYPTLVEGDPQPYGTRMGRRRGVLEAHLALPDGTVLVVISLHFKSRLPEGLARTDGSEIPFTDQYALAEARVRSQVVRSAEALYVRRRIEQLFDADERTQLAVCGDFNDGPDSVTVQAVAGDRNIGLPAGAPPVPFHPRALVAAARSVPESERYSVAYRGNTEQLDHILCSAALHQRLVTARFHNETLQEDLAYDGAPETGAFFSDHAPLLASFR